MLTIGCTVSNGRGLVNPPRSPAAVLTHQALLLTSPGLCGLSCTWHGLEFFWFIWLLIHYLLLPPLERQCHKGRDFCLSWSLWCPPSLWHPGGSEWSKEVNGSAVQLRLMGEKTEPQRCQRTCPRTHNEGPDRRYFRPGRSHMVSVMYSFLFLQHFKNVQDPLFFYYCLPLNNLFRHFFP